MKLAGLKSALNLVVYSTDRSKAMVPVLVLFFVALWFITRGDLSYVLTCVILFSCFSVLLALRYLAWERERASLGAFRTFVRLALVWFCLFPLPLDVWEGLRLVIVALAEIFSYPFFKSVGLLAQEKKRKIHFQDGRHGGHLEFPIDLQVTLMFPTKFK